MRLSIRILILLLSFSPVCLHAQELFVVVNKQSDIDTLDVNTVRKIYLGHPFTDRTIANLKLIDIEHSHPIFRDFCHTIMGKSPAQVGSHWSRLLFTGKGKPPKPVNNAQQAILIVENTANAIAYVISGADTSRVKVVLRVPLKD